jgi:hypothetical protein
MAQPKIEERPKSSAGAKVTVACKLPAGIVIRPYRWITRNENVMGGGSREVREAVTAGAPVVIRGYASKQNEAPRGPIVGGYALTFGVDKEIWDQWLEANRDSDMVRNELVFAHESREVAMAWAKEHEKTVSGLERMNPDGDPRAPRAPANVGNPTEEEERAKKRAAA